MSNSDREQPTDLYEQVAAVAQARRLIEGVC
jgi:hypothetical protein